MVRIDSTVNVCLFTIFNLFSYLSLRFFLSLSLFIYIYTNIVTAVGGTFGSKAGEEQLSTNLDQGLNIVSGGGFSTIFTSANGFDLSFQEAAVKSWREQPLASSTLPGYTLPDGTVGRGYPDVSAKSDNIFELIGGQLINNSGTRYEIM
jgi:hypothetical protein